jgi:glutamyl-tRNA synthetase
MHLGTARTALLAWLRARSQGGAFLLRLEDLDGPRMKPGAAEALMGDLRWLGLDWDEGPDRGGPQGPYEQSRRLDRYQAAFDGLKAQGVLFPCSCSRRELDGIASAPHGDESLYPGLCRRGPLHPERPQAWRFAMPQAEAVDDRFQGLQAPLRDDFVVRRADGAFSYQLACAVDDLAMGVTEVLRGDDLLASAARQQALFRAWGRTPPAWLHVPLLLGADGSRLAKRHGATAVAQWRAAGWKAEALVGLLAQTLGLAPVGAKVMPTDLVAGFEVGKLDREAWRFQGPWPD